MMELVNGYMQAQQQQLAMQMQVKVLKESMNMQKAVGNAVLSLMDAAMTPVGKSQGTGSHFDVYA
ncbi:MAG: putative motility protein [Planctomycetaceae bacterium]|jgi:hypothetical protein|nr:putative motility protein [Planctomycetaceae bacterium]